VIRTKVATETVCRNTVAVVAATLLPGLVLGLPATCAMLLPDARLFTLLHTLPLLCRPIDLLLLLLSALWLLLFLGWLLLSALWLLLSLRRLLLSTLWLLLFLRRLLLSTLWLLLFLRRPLLSTLWLLLFLRRPLLRTLWLLLFLRRLLLLLLLLLLFLVFLRLLLCVGWQAHSHQRHRADCSRYHYPVQNIDTHCTPPLKCVRFMECSPKRRATRIPVNKMRNVATLLPSASHQVVANDLGYSSYIPG
jgi:hypothetical protein